MTGWRNSTRCLYRPARAVGPHARFRQRPAAAAHVLDALRLARHRRRATRRDWRLRPGGHALRVQVLVVAADGLAASAAAARAKARLGNTHPDRAHRFAARLGFVRSQASSRPHGGVRAARGVSFREPGHRDRCLAHRNPPARSPGARRGDDPDRLPRRHVGFRGRHIGDCLPLRLVRGLRNDGSTAGRGNSRLLVRPRTRFGGRWLLLPG